ncbi:class D sortase [Niameybacter massiliensis]|uniref:Class D sortase n=1 Tax=Holtiella tumoricola TaxID=3018743 RepID=A0AA42DQP2_9FIRM|nr:class D sortase [Holtiella tumoricola]MDA3733146.1 class D sortase [Holtiella tumoricola]
MSRHIGKLLIVLGIIVLSLPMLGNIYTKYEQQKFYKNYLYSLSQLESSMETLQETLENGTEDEHGVQDNLEIQEKDQLNVVAQTPNGLEVLGMLSIPKIDVDLLFTEGVTKEALKYAVGHMPGTAMPGEVGNCAVAGHRSYTFGEYFNRLDELEVGDEITVSIGNETYTYRVYESFLVEPSEVWVTEPVEDRKVITLITCHPVVKATHRLIVRGELIE